MQEVRSSSLRCSTTFGMPGGILSGMDMTTVKMPKPLRDRIQREAAARHLTLAQEIARVYDERAPRPRPHSGGFRSSGPLSAEEIDNELAGGFGEDDPWR